MMFAGFDLFCGMWMLIAMGIGALIGYLSARYWRAAQSRQFDNILLGIVGGFTGNRLFESIGGSYGEEVTQNMNLQLGTAAIGAVLILVLIRLVRKPTKENAEGNS